MYSKRAPHPDSYYQRVERYGIDAPNTVLDYAYSQVGKPYDWQGVFNFFSRNRCWEDTDSWFCSELVAYAFKQAKYPLVRASAWRVTPGDLLLSTLLVPLDKPIEGQEYKDW